MYDRHCHAPLIFPHGLTRASHRFTVRQVQISGYAVPHFKNAQAIQTQFLVHDVLPWEPEIHALVAKYKKRGLMP